MDMTRHAQLEPRSTCAHRLLINGSTAFMRASTPDPDHDRRTCTHEDGLLAKYSQRHTPASLLLCRHRPTPTPAQLQPLSKCDPRALHTLGSMTHEAPHGRACFLHVASTLQPREADSFLLECLCRHGRGDAHRCWKQPTCWAISWRALSDSSLMPFANSALWQ